MLELYHLSTIQIVCVWIFPVILAIVLHELAHGVVASLCGDNTAKREGRLTLNPLAHISIVGTLIIPGLLMWAHAPAFGWAKPVPVNYANLRHIRRDSILVALAGPASNGLMLIAWVFLLKLLGGLPNPANLAGNTHLFIALMAVAGIQINTSLMIFNLLPLPPLDGSKVIMSLLPYKASQAFASIEPYGFFILLLLLQLGIINQIMSPLYQMVFSFINSILG